MTAASAEPRPSAQVTVIGVLFDGTMSPIQSSIQPRGTQRAPGTWPRAKSWLVSTKIADAGAAGTSRAAIAFTLPRAS